MSWEQVASEQTSALASEDEWAICACCGGRGEDHSGRRCVHCNGSGETRARRATVEDEWAAKAFANSADDAPFSF